MEKLNHEYYVLLEIAKLLKEAGFDWKIASYYVRYYEGDGNDDSIPTEEFRLHIGDNTCCTDYNNTPLTYINGILHKLSAPTLEVAQRWLREVKNIYVESVLCVNRGTSGYSYGFSIAEISADLSMVKILYPLTYFDEEETKGFKKYELSLEAGIKKALEIILEKGE